MGLCSLNRCKYLVHWEMQDAVSYKEQPFAFGITLEKLNAHTVDQNGKPTFVTSNPMELLRKVRSTHLKFAIASSIHNCWHSNICSMQSNLLLSCFARLRGESYKP